MKDRRAEVVRAFEQSTSMREVSDRLRISRGAVRYYTQVSDDVRAAAEAMYARHGGRDRRAIAPAKAEARRRRIVAALDASLTLEGVGQRLGIAANTVRYHVRRDPEITAAYERMLRRAMEQGIVSPTARRMAALGKRRDEVVAVIRQSSSQREVADTLGVSRAAVYHYVSRYPEVAEAVEEMRRRHPRRQVERLAPARPEAVAEVEDLHARILAARGLPAGYRE